MASPAMSHLLETVDTVMTGLVIHPLLLKADADGVELLTTMEEHALVTRSRGPYSPDNLPPEAMATAEWIALRLSVMEVEQPEFTVEGGGRWPQLAMLLPVSRVLVHFVVPEEAPPIYRPPSNVITLPGDIKLALRFLAKSLHKAGRHGAGEPPVTITLSYRDDPGYEARVAGLTEQFRAAVPPVIATFEVDRSRCGRKQRAAHDEALRSIAYTDQKIEKLGRTGFTVRIGCACIQDSGG